MKKLLIALITIACISGCYKEKVVDVYGIMTGQSWRLVYNTVGGVSTLQACDLNTVLSFKKDSTGKYFNPEPCDTNASDSIKFHWVLSNDRYHLYEHPDSNASQNIVWIIGRITHDSLQMEGIIPGGINCQQIYVRK